MKKVWLITGAVVLAFIAVVAWIVVFSGLGVLLNGGWDGGDLVTVLFVFAISVASSVGAVMLMMSAIRYKENRAAPPQWPLNPQWAPGPQQQYSQWPQSAPGPQQQYSQWPGENRPY